MIPNDKESGYTVSSANDLVELHELTLSKSCYIPVSVEDWNEAEMLRAYRKLCNFGFHH